MNQPTPSHLLVRDARDRIIDLLALGETYPLRDVDVVPERLTVSYGDPAVIGIEPGQLGVLYELCENGAPLDPQRTADGTGERTVLAGPSISVDRTFHIRATKIGRPQRQTFLREPALIKVGLDARLRAFIKDADVLNPSDPTRAADTEPRIVDYGSVAVVRVFASQKGAQYQLVYPGADGVLVMTSPVTGTGLDIDLLTLPLREDTRLRIRVTRTFAAGEGRSNLETYLDVTLPLAVRADPSLAVAAQGAALDGSPLVDPARSATVSIQSSQKNVRYTAFLRQLLDADFGLSATPDARWLQVSVPVSRDLAAHTVFVREPPRPAPFAVQEGFAPQGDTKAGTGATLILDLGPIRQDGVAVIRAEKQHRDSASGQLLGTSGVQLAQAAVILPRPDAVTLSLMVSAAASGSGGAMLVTGGQAGVFYFFRQSPDGTVIGPPAYFHRVDEQDPTQNRGVGQLAVTRDFVITRTPSAPPTDPATERPLPPLVDLATVPAGTSLSVTAVWARTGVPWSTPRTIAFTKT